MAQMAQMIRKDDGTDARDPETFAIIGAAMAVHAALGNGFLEAVYQEALGIELESRGIPFNREVELALMYRGKVMSTSYRVDFICYDSVLVELKALRDLTGIEESQVINYLKASKLGRALLLNFGQPRLQFRRFAHS